MQNHPSTGAYRAKASLAAFYQAFRGGLVSQKTSPEDAWLGRPGYFVGRNGFFGVPSLQAAFPGSISAKTGKF